MTGACLNGLVALMSKKDESTVAESVVVIKKLLQINVGDDQFESRRAFVVLFAAIAVQRDHQADRPHGR